MSEKVVVNYYKLIYDGSQHSNCTLMLIMVIEQAVILFVQTLFFRLMKSLCIQVSEKNTCWHVSEDDSNRACWSWMKKTFNRQQTVINSITTVVISLSLAHKQIFGSRWINENMCSGSDPMPGSQSEEALWDPLLSCHMEHCTVLYTQTRTQPSRTVHNCAEDTHREQSKHLNTICGIEPFMTSKGRTHT